MMKWVGHVSVLAIACFFAVMWGLVLRERVATAPVHGVRPDYDRLLGPEEERREYLMGIYWGEKRRGMTHTVIERGESGNITIHSSTRLQPADITRFVVPAGKELDVEFEADISPLSGLRSMRISSNALGAHLFGIKHEQEGVMRIRGRLAGSMLQTELEIPDEAFLGEAFAPLSGLPDLEQAREGETWTVHMLNPLLGSFDPVRVTLGRSQRVEVAGETVRIYEIVFHVGTHLWRAWVTGEGEVLYQGTPFGFVLIREDLPPSLARLVRREVGEETPQR